LTPHRLLRFVAALLSLGAAAATGPSAGAAQDGTPVASAEADAGPPPPPVPDAPSVDALRRRLDGQTGRPGLPESTWVGIAYQLDTAARIDRRFPYQSAEWRLRAARFLDAAEAGRDPYPAARGEIVPRGYRSDLVEALQGYALYLPPNYDPSRKHPVMVVLHGGSSNGNLFLGVVLGRNLPWTDYKKHLWDLFTPRWAPEDWIVVAPDGFGQVMWRWMGEQDVLDVIDDVRRSYSVDDDRIVLGGLSNGGVGAYALGSRHAHRFAQVQAMAGAPSWVQYAGGLPRRAAERRALLPWSGLHLIENTTNTDFRWFHGTDDTGPMRPEYVRQYEARVARLGLPNQGTWYEAGHDILYRVHRHGRIYERLDGVHRDPRPAEVRLVTGDYRAATQHWVTVTRLAAFPRLGRVHARAATDAAGDAGTVTVTTENVRAVRLDLRQAPVPAAGSLRVVVDGTEVFAGPREAAGDRLHLRRSTGGETAGTDPWRTAFPEESADGRGKRPGLSGPITDAYYTPLIHVYGTRRPAHTEALRDAAERGAGGWPLWLWGFDQPVVADADLSREQVARSHLVLYGTPGANALLEAFAEALPIAVTDQGVRVGAAPPVEGPDVGVRFVFPNPAALAAGRDRYLIVQAGPTPEAVAAGHRLPDFLPDWVVYDEGTTRRRSRLLTGANRPVDLGWFDDRWRLPEDRTGGAGGGGGELGAARPGWPLGPVLPGTPPRPEPPAAVLPAPDDPAARAARLVAHRLAHFPNVRGTVPRGAWTLRPDAVWRVPGSEPCLRALRAAGVPADPAPAALGIDAAVPTPVVLRGSAGPLVLRDLHPDRPLVVACPLAERLGDLGRALARVGVTAIDVVSGYRRHPFTSLHRMGLGLDVSGVSLRDGRHLRVRDHFEETPGHRTCAAPPADTRNGRAMRRVVCALFDSGLFSTVLTPNYNAGHRDHLHLDLRPDDPRQFLR